MAQNFMSMMMNQGGTMKMRFQECKNKKNNIVQTINYQSQYSKTPLALLRLQDYLIFNNNSNVIPNVCRQGLQGYMSKVSGGGSAVSGNPLMKPGTQGMFNNTNNALNKFNSGASTMTGLNLPGSRNISIPGMSNNTGTMNNTSSLFNNTSSMNRNPGTTATNLFNTQGNKPMGMGMGMGAAPSNPMTQSTLFSKPATTGLGTSSMFNTNTGTSLSKPSALFNTTPGVNTTGGMFNNQNKPASTGLFNSGNTSSMFKTPGAMGSTGGLGATMNKPGGLFSNNSTASTGLFNNNNNSLLGNKNNMMNKPGGVQGTSSLFNNNANTGTQSMFNAPYGMNNQGGQNNQMNRMGQMNQMNQMPMQQMGMPMNMPNGGYAMVVLPLNDQGKNNGGSTLAMPTNNSQQYKNIMNNIASLTGNKPTFSNSNEESLNTILEKFKKFDTDHFQNNTTAYSEKQSTDQFYDSVLSLSYQESPFVVSSSKDNYLKAKANAKKILKGMRSRRKKNTRATLQKSLNRSFLKKPKPEEMPIRPKKEAKNVEEKPKLEVVEKLSEPQIMSKKASSSVYGRRDFGEPIELTLILGKFGRDSKWKIEVDPEDYFSVILDKAVQMNLYQEDLLSSLSLLHKKAKLPLDQKIKDHDFEEDFTLHLYRTNNTDKYFAEMSVIPTCTREDLVLSPDIIDLSRMTEEELKGVCGFVLENEHGRIEFLEEVDLRNVNFDEVVKIEAKCIEVYGNLTDEQKPKKGEGMNHPAMITFFNFEKKKGMTREQFLHVLKKYSKKINAEFIGYDEEEKEVTIKVDNF